MPRICFIGFGEAASAFRSGWGSGAQADISAYDIKSATAAGDAVMQARYAQFGVRGAAESAAALKDAEVVFSLVTADQAVKAAAHAFGKLAPGALWLDCNSCAPQTKQAAEVEIVAAGGRYVDVAVMAPVHPKKHHVPLLVSGGHAQAAVAVLQDLDMRPKSVGGGVGGASAVKMLRSVMVKGMEALSAECFLAARRAGVEADVIASLDASDPGANWRAQAAYNLERMMVHGTRRAAEMGEVVATLTALDLPPTMAQATQDWQARIGALALESGPDELTQRLDRLLKLL